MQKSLFSIIAGSCLSFSAQAVVLSQWTLETNTPADLTNNVNGPVVTAEAGVFTTGYTLAGVHASAASDWTTPAGHGTISGTNSYNSNNWTAGDYYAFTTSTLGYTGITVSLNQMGSDTGPSAFALRYSTDNINFTTFSSYSVTNDLWGGLTAVLTNTKNFDLSSITALDNVATVYFRLVNTGTVSINGGTVGTAGTSRVDNVTINGVPEPAAIFLGSLGLLGILRRRR